MLVNLADTLDDTLERILFNAMINPNKALYVKTMSLETLAKLMSGDNQEKIAMVWKVLRNAIDYITIQEQEQAEQAEQEQLDLLALEPTPLLGCPHCGYDYADGYKVCPNCACDMEKAEQELEQAYYESATLDDMACEYAKHGNNSYYGNIEKLVKKEKIW